MGGLGIGNLADDLAVVLPPAGLHELAIESDGADKPSRMETGLPGSHAPFSLWVRSVGLISGHPKAVAAKPGESANR